MAVQDGGASESVALLDRIGGDDDRRRITSRLHDVPQQARPFLVFLL